MEIIVQKFGGTSLATESKREQVVEKISRAKRSGYSPVVVVSAIGRKGDPYATDTLLSLIDSNNGNLSKRDNDILLSCGELISGSVITAMLNKKGLDPVLLTGGQAGLITSNDFSDAKIIEICTDKLTEFLQKGKTVVVAGFQGMTKDGEITTLGRGGSDTTAAALGVALDAQMVEIYTDVNGIKTADPRIVEDAKTLEAVTYTEICQLAHEGAKVIHPRAVEIAMKHNLPLKVKCTFSDEEGTVVTSKGRLQENSLEINDYRLITGITSIPNITQLKVDTSYIKEGKGIELKIFKAMALADISLDFINVTPYYIMFTVKQGDTEKAVDVLENMDLTPEVRKGCAKVAAIGAGMAGTPGVMASIVEALTKEGVNILQSADSHTTIWCLVNNKDMEKAVRALHKQFKLNA
ncbi:aspartate kinase [Desulfitispora alkaliphila]|uniref:aspartate kinase n=1 Tax=Desulfitispora alkaliphila TaxID=622674 RepID=UPI003D1BBD95